MCYTHRRLFAQLAKQLIMEHKDKQALAVLNKCVAEIPSYNVPNNYVSGSLDLAECYAILGQKAKAKELFNDVWKNSTQYMNWYLSLDGNNFAQSMSDCLREMSIMQECNKVAVLIDAKLAQRTGQQFQNLFNMYRGKGGILPSHNN